MTTTKMICDTSVMRYHANIDAMSEALMQYSATQSAALDSATIRSLMRYTLMLKTIDSRSEAERVVEIKENQKMLRPV